MYFKEINMGLILIVLTVTAVLSGSCLYWQRRSNNPGITLSRLRRAGAALLLLFLLSSVSWGQAAGDYRTNASPMNWDARTSWQRYNGFTWQTPTNGQGYPGQYSGPGTVTIRNGHNVTLNVSPANSIDNLIVGGGTSGTLQSDGSNRTLNISGDLTIANGATFNLSRITLNVTGTTIVSGTLSDSHNNGSSTFAGPFQVNNGGSFSTANNSPFIFRGGIINNGSFSKSGSGQTSFNTNSQTISGVNELDISGGNVIIADNITVTNQGIVSIQGILNGSNGGSTWLNDANSTLNYGNATQPMATGILTATSAGNTVHYIRSGAQSVSGTTYNNLTISGGNTKTINNHIRVNGELALNGAVLSLGSYDLTLGTGATAGGTFSAASMIDIGSRSVIKEGNSNPDFIITMPIGIGTDYTPVNIADFSATNITSGSRITIGSAATPAPGVTGTHPLKRHWITSTSGISGSVLADISFAYLPSDIPAGGTSGFYEIVYLPASGIWGMPGGAGAAGTNPLRATAATTLDATWTGTEPEKRIFYSLKTGSWDEPETWTLDPSGTQPLNPNSYTPSSSPTTAYDEVVILSGRTVTVASNNKTNRSLTVDGTIDFGSTTGHSFSTISGTGRVRLAGDNFPAGDATDFISPGQGQGTVEYYGTTRNLTVSRTFYNVDVNVSSGNTLSLLTDYQVNGDLSVSGGIMGIGNNLSVTPVAITVKGNVEVSASGRIATGTAGARHTLNIYGNLTNNGEARFTNRTSANYMSEATNGITDVNFVSPDRNQAVICRGITIFYRIGIDKGTNSTYVLDLDASNQAYFNLYGYANENHSPAVSQLTVNNNALGLVRGTVRIGNNINIPVLSSADVYCISAGAQLWVDRGSVQKNTNGTIAVYGSLKITDGLLEALTPGGITFRNNGVLDVGGGVVNASQIRTSDVGALNYGGYLQTGGVVNVTGGAVNADYYVFSLPYPGSVFTMSGGVLTVNTASGTGGILVNSNPENIKVTGGTVVAETNSSHDFLITSTAPFWNLTLKNSTTNQRLFTLGPAANIGPDNINVPAQELKVLNDFRIWGKESGGSSYPEIIFNPGVNDLHIGGSFFIETGSLYAPVSGGVPPYDAISDQPTGRNTTYFIKTPATGVTEELYRGDAVNPLELGNLVVDRTGGYEVKLTSSATRANESVIMDVNGNASVLSGTLNQNLFTIRTWGAITNNGRMGTWHPGVTPSRAQIQLVENPSLTLNTGSDAVFGNVQINVTPPSVLMLTSDVYIERMEFVKGLIYLRGFNLRVDNMWNLEAGIFQNVPATSYLRVFNSGRSGSSMIYTDGKAGDGGLTLRVAANSQAENENNILNNFGPVTFPVGFTPDGGTTLYFRPAQLVVKNYSSPGYITIRPVTGALQTTNQGGGEVLQHYWRVSHSGFTVLPTVSYRFYYRNQTGVTGVDLSTTINETGYVPGKVLDEAPYTRQSESTADIVRSFESNSRAITINGTTTDGSFSPSSAGITLENANYTAGVASRFTGSVLIYYTRDVAQEARWNNAAAWTRSDILNTAYEPHDSRQPASSTVPGTGDVAVIGWIPWNDEGRTLAQRGLPHGIWITDTRQVAEVVFTKMTDAAGNPVPRAYRSNFQFRPTLAINGRDGDNGILYAKLVKGEGLFWNRGSDPDYTIMDIGDFARQDSSYVIYENFTNGRIIYNTPALFPNIYISNDNWGANNHDFTFANDINTTGNVELLGNVNLVLPTGATGNINAGRNLVMFQAGSSGGGASLDFGNTGTVRKVTIQGSLLISNTNAAIRVRNAATTGTVMDHELHVRGDIIQSSSGSVLNLAPSQNIRQRINLYLEGTGSMVYNMTGGNIPALYRLIVNKGNSTGTTAQFNTGFNLYGPVSGTGVVKALELQNGLFILNDASINLNLTTGDDHFAVPATAGLEIRQGTATASGNSGIALDGLLRLSGGNLNMSGGDNPIEYSASGNATIHVTGGTLTVGGQIRRSPSSDAGILHYLQSGGTVIAGNNAATVNNRGVFEILNAGSTFIMTGGDLYIARSQTNPSVPAFYFNPETCNIGASANLHIGHSSTPSSQIIGIHAGKPLPRLRINNTSAANPKVTARLETVAATITSLLQIDAGTSFDANGLDLILNGDMYASGTFIPEGNTTYFSGGGTQTINGTGNTVTFYNIDKTAQNDLVLNAGNTPLLVLNALSLQAGTLRDNGNTITVRGNVLNNASHVNNGAGDGIVMSGNITQVLAGNGTFGKLTISNNSGVSIPVGNQLFITGSLKMQAGVLNIGSNLLDLGINAVIEEASPFSSANMIETNISFTDNGVRKTFRPDASPVFTFPMGSGNKYTPVMLNITANGNDTGSITVKAANEVHPGILEDTESGPQIVDRDNALQYYWTLRASDITGFSAVARMKYDEDDVRVTVPYTVADYHTASLLADGAGTWQKFPKTDFDETNGYLIFNFDNNDDAGISGDYTAGAADATLDGAIPNTVSRYETINNGDWATATVWTPNISGGPRGAIAVINAPHTVDVTTNYIPGYMTEVYGTLKLYSTFGHRLGIVNGTGTIYLETGAIPAAVYDGFFSPAGGTIEFGGTDSYEALGNITGVNNLVFSGTGQRKLPNNNLLINGDLIISGETGLNVINYYNRRTNIKGGLTRISGSFDSGSGANATVSFTGTLNQVITGSFAGSNSFNNLEVSNANDITVLNDVEIDRELKLTNGLINVNTANLFRLKYEAFISPAAGTSSSFVNGPVTKELLNGSTFIFPVGNNTGVKAHGPVALLNVSGPSGINDWKASYFYNSPTLAGYSTSGFKEPISTVSNTEYWKIEAPSGGASVIRITLDGSSDVASSLTDLSNLRIAGWNVTDEEWEVVGNGAAVAGTATSGTITTTAPVNYGSYSVFTLASVTPVATGTATITSPPAVNLCSGSSTIITVNFTGEIPYVLTYTVGAVPQTTPAINTSSYNITVSPSATTVCTLTGVTANGVPGVITGASSVTVSVSPVPSVTLSRSGGSGAICEGTSITFTASAGLANYDFRLNGVSVQNGAGNTYTTSTLAPGTQSVDVRGTNAGGCNATSSAIEVLVNPLPAAAGTISGPASVCRSSGGTYSIPAIANATGYTWTTTNGATIAGSGTTRTITFPNSGTSVITVYGVNGCGNGTASTLNVAVSTFSTPGAAGPISGSPEVCSGGMGYTYSVGAVSNATSYIWAYSGTGATINGTGNSVTIDFASGATSGNLTVRGTNGCATGTVSPSFAIVTNAPPIATITPPAPSVCSGTPLAITGTPSGGTAPYTHSWTGDGAGSLSSTTIANPLFTSPAGGSYQLVYTVSDSKGCSGSANTTVTVFQAPVAAAGSDVSGLCTGTSPIAMTGASAGGSYSGTPTWSGAGGTWTQNPDPALATFTPSTLSGTVTATLTLTGANGCSGVSDSRVISWSSAPVQPGAFTVSSPTVCRGQTGVTYTVPADPMAISYNWTYTTGTGATIYGSGNSVTVDFSSGATSGRLNVTATSSCGTSIPRSVDITVTVPPVATFSYAGSPYCPTAADPFPAFSGGGIPGSFSSTAGLVFVSTATGQVDLSASTPGNYIVTNTVPASGGCSVSIATSPISIRTEFEWTGSLGTDWNTPGNWSCGMVPTGGFSARISDVPNNPVLSAGAAGTINNLIIDNGATLTVTGNTISISGSITNNGAFTATDGTIALTGTSAQTIGSGIFTGNTINSLIINNPAGVTMTGSLGVSGVVLVQNGTLASDGHLTLLSDASGTALVDGSGNGNITGDVTMQRYLASAYGYKYFSSPFSDATVSEFGDDMNLASSFPLFYRYDENRTSSGWVGYSTGTNILAAMAGYAVNFGAEDVAKTVDVTGEVNNGNLSVTLYNHNRAFTKGFNLVGNPYPSPIDWDASTGWTRANVDDAVYYFRASTTDEYGGTYSSYVDGVPSEPGVSTNIIPSMQGFFVHVTDTFPATATLGMTNSVRISDRTHPFLKSAVASTRFLLRVTAAFTDDAASVDPLVVYFDDAAEPSFDNRFDALKLMNTDMMVTNFYSVLPEGMKLSINALPGQADSALYVPLGLKTYRDGEVIFRMRDMENLPEGVRVWFRDAVTGRNVEFLPQAEYKVNLTAGDYDNRFTLGFRKSTTGIDDMEGSSELFDAYPAGEFVKATVRAVEGNRGVIMICDLTGRPALITTIHETGHYEIPANVKPGLYIIRYTTGNRQYTKKLTLGIR